MQHLTENTSQACEVFVRMRLLKMLLIQGMLIDKEPNLTNLFAQNGFISFLNNYNNKAIIIISKFLGVLSAVMSHRVLPSGISSVQIRLGFG